MTVWLFAQLGCGVALLVIGVEDFVLTGHDTWKRVQVWSWLASLAAALFLAYTLTAVPRMISASGHLFLLVAIPVWCCWTLLRCLAVIGRRAGFGSR
ncbi:MAG: hypothetical protein ABL904_21980 [Hyphomicrobiaceae bacterium]